MKNLSGTLVNYVTRLLNSGVLLLFIFSTPYLFAYDVHVGAPADIRVIDGRLYVPAGTTLEFWAEPGAGFPGSKVYLHFSIVDQNYNWVDPRVVEMIFDPASAYPGTVKASVGPFYGSLRMEFVIESGGTWYKASVAETAWLPSEGPHNGPRIPGYKYAEAQLLSDGQWNFVIFYITPPITIIDFPRDGERITSPAYTLKMIPNSSTNNVRVSIDGGDWLQARREPDGYWYYDWSGYSEGTHTIKAEAWNIFGERYETPLKTVVYKP